MKKDDAKKMSDEALAELASQLQEGRTEEYDKYLDAMSRFHNYSFGNCLLIARQKPDATLVARRGDEDAIRKLIELLKERGDERFL